MSIDNIDNDTNQSSKDLRNFDFSGRELSGFDFSRADLRGADFTGCRLHGTNFAEADIRGTVFTDAQFYDPALRGVATECLNEITSEHCDDCIDGDGCSELSHFLSATVNWVVWDRPDSRFMGTYGEEQGDWWDGEALEAVVLPLLPDDEMVVDDTEVDYVMSELWSSEMCAVTDSIYWSRFAHNATAFLVHAVHDETTVWPGDEHLKDFPFWNQPDHVAWSPIGTFCDE